MGLARGSKRGHRDNEEVDEAYSKTAAVVVVVPHARSNGSANAASNNHSGGGGLPSRWQAKLEQLADHLLAQSFEKSEATGEGRPWRDQQSGDNDDDGPFESVFTSVQKWKGNEGAWNDRMTTLQQSSHTMRADVQDKLESLIAALEERSEQNYRLQLRITELKAAYRSAVQHLEQELESQRSQRRHELSTIEAEWEKVQQEARELFREQGEEIPRLQHMIALYSSCTGIKWYDDDACDDDKDEERGANSKSATMTTPDYKMEKALARRPILWRGEVAVPALHQLQEFAFDASDPFHSANAVWRIMGGHTDVEISQE